MVLITLRARTARRRFEETAAQAPGEVTDMRWESVGQAGDRSMLAFPIVRFSLPDGRTVETRTRSGSNPPPAKQGAQVTVFYDPANPTDAAIPGGTVTTIVSAGLIGIGGVFIAIALAFAAFLTVVL
jgi:hypothetical protein